MSQLHTKVGQIVLIDPGEIILPMKASELKEWRPVFKPDPAEVLPHCGPVLGCWDPRLNQVAHCGKAILR